MKRLLSVCLLMLCLSIPGLAGHTLAGGYCDCGAPGCICDQGEEPRGNASLPADPIAVDLGSGTLFVLTLLLLALRYKA